jgi:hypothetical protein
MCKQKGENGRDWTRTNDLTDVNRTNGGRVVYAILLVVESFNKGRFWKEPWGLICNLIVNQPLGAKLINIDAILQPPNQASISYITEFELRFVNSLIRPYLALNKEGKESRRDEQ